MTHVCQNIKKNPWIFPSKTYNSPGESVQPVLDCNNDKCSLSHNSKESNILETKCPECSPWYREIAVGFIAV